jgi:hypothetical protein
MRFTRYAHPAARSLADAALMRLLQQRLEAKARRESARARPKSKFY